MIYARPHSTRFPGVCGASCMGVAMNVPKSHRQFGRLRCAGRR